ncbi:MAG: monooxygenase, partial [Bradyrhizobium sp.]
MLDKTANSETDNLATAARDWLAAFESALTSPGVPLNQLFQAESFWRDVLALSWSIKTVGGADAIVKELTVLGPRAMPREFRIDPDRTPPRRATRAGTSAIEAIFTFETEVGRGDGILRLVPDADDGNRLKAWTLL